MADETENKFLRARILESDDDIPWRTDIHPDEVGLRHVLIDEEGKLWTIMRVFDGLVLRRILPHV